MAKRNCGNCKWCSKEGEDLVCTNIESEYIADFVEKNHSCDEWEGENKCE